MSSASLSSYDVEDESILSTVFKDAFPDSWRGNAEFAQYLSELSSYGVDKLNREPDRLAEERAQILAQTQDLAFHNYKTFIQTAECSKEIFQDFQVIEKHVNALLDKLPELNTQCGQFLKSAQEINTSRRMNSMTLQRHTQLLEILEMPQLMDTCVRNGYYEEALELAAHVKRLEKKHANIPVIVNIVEEVKNSTQLMLNQLIQQLRSNIQLPACLRVIGYLRRMDVFTEAELRIKFLQARDSWFQGILSGIPTDDPYYHITKTIEASRVHLFDIITQYRAIFSDEEPILSPSKDSSSMNEAALFHGWVIQKVSHFLATLEHDLQRGIGGRLDSLLGQCMYFGLSFSRVGADFRGLLAPIFQRAALQTFKQSILEANQRFDEAMQSYTLLGTLSSVPSSALSLASQTGGSLHPPSVLLEYQPLAAYCNHILVAFNDLRLCAPLSLACDIADHVQMSLTQAAECILAYHRAEESTFNPQEADKFGNFCRVFAEELVPFLNKCLQTMFPPNQIAQMLGLHAGELTSLGFIGTMDIDTILLSIEHLLPAKPEPQPHIEPDIIKPDGESGDDKSEDADKTETNQSEVNTEDMSPETDQSQVNTEDIPPETDQSQLKTQDIPPETDQSQANTQDIPPENDQSSPTTEEIGITDPVENVQKSLNTEPKTELDPKTDNSQESLENATSDSLTHENEAVKDSDERDSTGNGAGDASEHGQDETQQESSSQPESENNPTIQESDASEQDS